MENATIWLCRFNWPSCTGVAARPAYARTLSDATAASTTFTAFTIDDFGGIFLINRPWAAAMLYDVFSNPCLACFLAPAGVKHAWKQLSLTLVREVVRCPGLTTAIVWNDHVDAKTCLIRSVQWEGCEDGAAFVHMQLDLHVARCVYNYYGIYYTCLFRA